MNIERSKEFLTKQKHECILRLGQKLQVQKQLEEAESSLSEVAESIRVLNEIQEVLKEVSRTAREYAKIELEKMGSFALRYVYGPGYGFEIEFDTESRSGTDALFYITSMQNGEKRRSKPNGKDGGNRGGGAIIILALSLRIAMMKFSDPPIDGPLILDEPFKELDENRRPLAIKFLIDIAKEFDMQIICVTHDPLLKSMASKRFDFAVDRSGYCQVTVAP